MNSTGYISLENHWKLYCCFHLIFHFHVTRRGPLRRIHLQSQQPPTVLLRQAWREGKRIRRKTIANLSKLPAETVAGIRILLRGGVALPHPARLGRFYPRPLTPVRPTPHPAHSPSRSRGLALASDSSSLGSLLGLGPVSGNELLNLPDWLHRRQSWIQRRLARRHLQGGTLILYDVTSSYFEGRRCPLAAFGFIRDRKRDMCQIVCGLPCAADGYPVAAEVFVGNTADPTTASSQVGTIRERFGITRVALAGDRGMLTSAHPRGSPARGPGLDLGPESQRHLPPAEAPPAPARRAHGPGQGAAASR